MSCSNTGLVNGTNWTTNPTIDTIGLVDLASPQTITGKKTYLLSASPLASAPNQVQNYQYWLDTRVGSNSSVTVTPTNFTMTPDFSYIVATLNGLVPGMYYMNYKCILTSADPTVPITTYAYQVKTTNDDTLDEVVVYQQGTFTPTTTASQDGTTYDINFFAPFYIQETDPAATTFTLDVEFYVTNTTGVPDIFVTDQVIVVLSQAAQYIF